MKLKKEAYGYIIMLGHLCADISGGALPAILPFLMTQKGISYTSAAGLTFALSSIGSIIQPLFGSMADKHSRPWLMAAGIFMSGCGISMLGFLDSYAAMFVAVAITGIGSAIFHPDGGRMANYVAGEAKGKGISNFSVGRQHGAALWAPYWVVAGINAFGMRGTAVLAIPAFAMAAFLLTQNSRFRQFAAEGSRATAEAIAHGQKDDWKSFSKLTGVVFLRSTITMGMNTFIPLFFLNILMQSEARSGSVTTIISISGASRHADRRPPGRQGRLQQGHPYGPCLPDTLPCHNHHVAQPRLCHLHAGAGSRFPQHGLQPLGSFGPEVRAQPLRPCFRHNYGPCFQRRRRCFPHAGQGGRQRRPDRRYNRFVDPGYPGGFGCGSIILCSRCPGL